MSAHRSESEVDVTARVLASVARRAPALVREALPTALPWVRFLPAAGIHAMADELVVTMEAPAAIGNTTAVSQLLIEWRHTAEIHADPDLHRALTRQALADFGPVPRPARFSRTR